MPRPKHYNPPEPRKLDRFAHDVCRELGQDHKRSVVVAEVRHERTHEPNDLGVNQKARDYALSKLVYCAHCEKQAQEQDDPRLRERLTEGPNTRKKRRYKHKPGVVCGVTNRKVPADIIEAEFGQSVGPRQSRQGLGYLDLRGWGAGAIQEKAGQKWESFSQLASRSLPPCPAGEEG